MSASAASLVRPIRIVPTFLMEKNVIELSVLWAIHAILATTIFLPGTPLDVLRSAAALVYLLLVPGLLLVHLLKVYQEDPLAQLVTAVGLSLVYDMVLGLVLSGIPSSAIEQPLAAEFFVPASLAITGSLALAAPPGQRILASFAPIAKFRYLGWALLPFAAIFVALHVQSGGSNVWMVILLTVLAASPLLLLVRRPTAMECAAAIFSIALALAFHKYFVAPEFSGWDFRIEVYHASQVLDAGRWSPQASHIYAAMLSVTGLPAVASAMTGLDMMMTFIILNAVILAIVPVTLFLNFRILLGIRWATAVAFLYLGYFVFITVGLGAMRQSVAMFLATLLLTTVICSRASTNVRILQVALALSIVFSHYSTLFIIAVAFGASLLLGNLVRRRVPLSLIQTSTPLSLGLLVAVLVFAFLWFTWASNDRLFTAFVATGERVATAIGNELLFNLQATSLSRGNIPDGYSFKILLLANWIVVLGSALGFAICLHGILRRDSFRTRFGIICSGGIVLGGIFLILPETSESFNTQRALFMTFPWLLPLTVYGVKWTYEASGLSRRRVEPALAAVAGLSLFMYIALGTGLVTHVARDEPLNYALAETWFRAFNFYDQAALRFVTRYTADDTRIYADRRGQRLFHTIHPHKGFLLSGPNLPASTPNGFYLYLRSENLAGQWHKRARGQFNDQTPEVTLSEMVDYVFYIRKRTNQIYQSGGSELLHSGGGVGDSGL